ncbi:MAG: 2-amino-4-hydroxy-6-hydroxymethyldihydropteridine diphosphokinase [Deltaproteobacteria bacterium]|nr:2-amino-4-hydroxy-6-hydroxymethyldihydropteridine diphosphokinase [Candidatus Anaeroferrophillus wilburensis]MBN2890138.1 2-amino-4-hydroxy-6-hydroxymethyldihydropteridine diphosphokinase [Deltaproteobacteria bacterium]
MSVYIGFGTNLGDRLGYIKQALEQIAALPETRIIQVSSIYETAPVGFADQGNFLNGVCRLATSLSPDALLQALLAIEDHLGRVRTVRWGPRTIDLDILFYGDLIIRQSKLTIPHPAIADRGFVLYPLQEIAASFIHPELGESIASLVCHFQQRHQGEVPPVVVLQKVILNTVSCG